MNLQASQAQMTSMFAGKMPFVVLIGLLAATPLTAQTVLEKAARDEAATVADTDPNMAAAMRKAQATLADFLRRQGRARRTSLSRSPFAKVSASNIFGLRLLPITAASSPARSIIRRAWFTR